MAIKVKSTQVQPHVRVVTEYTVRRLGPYASVEFRVQDCLRVQESPVAITTAVDSGGDGTFDQITVPAWDGRTDLLGREVDHATDRDADGKPILIGKIVAWDEDTNTATLKDAIGTDPSGWNIALVKNTSFNNVQHQPVPGSLAENRHLSSGNPKHAEYLQNQQISSYVDAVVRVLAAMGDTTYTAAEVQAGVIALAQDGWITESIFAKAMEQAEEDIESGVLSMEP